MPQYQFLFQEYLNPLRLKAGKDKCPCCGKLMRAYCKTLDDRLVKLAWDIAIYLQKNKRQTFNPREVFTNYHHILDFQKLGYWGIVARTDKSGWWKMTKKGWAFLMGKIKLPKKVWVFNKKVVLEEDVYFVGVDNPDPRWQEERSDYTLDYLPHKYQTEIKLI